jgi:hypothetical protein
VAEVGAIARVRTSEISTGGGGGGAGSEGVVVVVSTAGVVLVCVGAGGGGPASAVVRVGDVCDQGSMLKETASAIPASAAADDARRAGFGSAYRPGREGTFAATEAGA